jgi:hypothetical protein
MVAGGVAIENDFGALCDRANKSEWLKHHYLRYFRYNMCGNFQPQRPSTVAYHTVVDSEITAQVIVWLHHRVLSCDG